MHFGRSDFHAQISFGAMSFAHLCACLLHKNILFSTHPREWGTQVIDGSNGAPEPLNPSGAPYWNTPTLQALMINPIVGPVRLASDFAASTNSNHRTGDGSLYLCRSSPLEAELLAEAVLGSYSRNGLIPSSKPKRLL